MHVLTLSLRRRLVYVSIAVLTIGFAGGEDAMNVLGYVGDTVDLQCGADGMQWRFHGDTPIKDLYFSIIVSWEDGILEGTSTLQIQNLSNLNAGTYTCRNGFDIIYIDLVTLEKGRKLNCTFNQPADGIFLINETIVVNCEILGLSGNMPPFMKWTSPETLSSDGMEWRFPASPRLNGLRIQGSVYFKLHDVSEVPVEENAAISKTIASNELFLTEPWKSPVLTVHYPPGGATILQAAMGPESFSGGEELNCTVSVSKPRAEQYWEVHDNNDTETVPGPNITVPFYDDTEGATNTYTYQCVAENIIRNQIYQVRSEKFTVTLDPPPPTWPIIVGGTVGGVALLVIVIITVVVVCHQRSVGPLTCPCTD